MADGIEPDPIDAAVPSVVVKAVVAAFGVTLSELDVQISAEGTERVMDVFVVVADVAVLEIVVLLYGFAGLPAITQLGESSVCDSKMTPSELE